MIDIIIVLVAFGIVFLGIRHHVKQRRENKSVCGGCSGKCPSKDDCSSVHKEF